MLPISKIVIEINRFDFQRIENPKIRNWEYQKGRLSGFKDVFEAVSYQQEGKCLLCKDADIELYHHIVPRSKGGSNTLDNYAGLCRCCHEKVHKDIKAFKELEAEKQGIKKKYHALSVINQIMKHLLDTLPDILPTYVTTGYETKITRNTVGLEKDHYVDAWCIAASVIGDYEKPEFTGGIHNIKQFRRHERANINNQRERTYYLDGKQIAKNRKPRFEQKGPALSDLALADTEISRLTVEKSVRRYNIRNRYMPGSVFLYEGKYHVMSGQLTGGKYLRALGDKKTNYPAIDCKILGNAGLVFVN